MEIETVKNDVGMGWEMVRLGDVFTQIKNGASIKQTDGLSGIPITRIETISNSFIDFNKLGYADINDDSFQDFYLENGDILMSHINSWIHLGKNALVENIEQKIIHGMNLLLLKANKEILSPKFSKYYFDTDLFRLQLNKISNQSVNQSSFSVTKLRDLQIPLPSLPIQRRIAEILDAADALKRKDQQLLKKYDELAQAIFMDMFGDPVKNEKGWEVGLTENYIDLLTGYAFKSEQYSNDNRNIRLCGGLIIMPWGIEWDKANRWEIKSKCELERYYLKVNDIVMAMDRPWISSGFKIAMIKKEDIPSLLVQRTARIRVKGINEFFLYFLFKHPGFERHASPTETTVPHISPNDIRTYKIILPPLELQNEYAEKIINIETQKSNIKALMKFSDSLFQTLLQKAFKGELV